jgi:hypothetical protein
MEHRDHDEIGMRAGRGRRDADPEAHGAIDHRVHHARPDALPQRELDRGRAYRQRHHELRQEERSERMVAADREVARLGGLDAAQVLIRLTQQRKDLVGGARQCPARGRRRDTPRPPKQQRRAEPPSSARTALLSVGWLTRSSFAAAVMVPQATIA